MGEHTQGQQREDSSIWRTTVAVNAFDALVEALLHLQDLAEDGRWDLVAQYIEGPNTGFAAALRLARGEWAQTSAAREGPSNV